MQYWKRIFLTLLLGGSSAIGAPPQGVIPSSLTPSSPVNNPGRQLLQQTQPQATSGRPAILAPKVKIRPFEKQHVPLRNSTRTSTIEPSKPSV